MASRTMMSSLHLQFQRPRKSKITVANFNDSILTLSNLRSIIVLHKQQNELTRQPTSCSPSVRPLRYLSKSILAAGSGSEAMFTDSKVEAVSFKNAEIVVESQKENEMQLRVYLTGEETQRVFDQVLTNLARTAPPVPGFRRQKGGKTSKVPKDFLLHMLGEDRVTKFVIQEIVTSTVADYVKKENLTVKKDKVSTTQTAEELESLFAPGKSFRFNATLELESLEAEVEVGVESSSSDDQ